MKNIIFDLGGVVIDWSPKRVVEEFHGDARLPEHLFKKGFFEEYWTEFDRGTLSLSLLIEKMSEFTGFAVRECEEFIMFIRNSLVDIPRTTELIRELSEKGYSLYCLSNMSVEFYDYLKVREVFRYFDGQIISGLENLIKPDPRIYRLLLERYDLNPDDSLFIDDLEANIQAARKEGIHGVVFADKEQGYREIETILQKAK